MYGLRAPILVLGGPSVKQKRVLGWATPVSYLEGPLIPFFAGPPPITEWPTKVSSAVSSFQLLYKCGFSFPFLGIFSQ